MDKKENEKVEKTTLSSEFVCSVHGWITMEDQKKRAKELEKRTEPSVSKGDSSKG